MDKIELKSFIPSAEDLKHIESGLTVIQVNSKSTFHRWKDVFDEKIFFKKQSGSSKVFRAVSITIPTYHRYGASNSLTPEAFIYGIDIDSSTNAGLGGTIFSKIDSSIKFIQ